MTAPARTRRTTAVLVPVKGFGRAKARLAGALSPVERAHLARTLATGVVRAARRLPTTVACDDEAVAAWAEGRGAGVVWTAGLGLDAAVARGVELLCRAGADEVIIVPGDLGRPTDLRRFCGPSLVTLVPDRRCDGTNLARVPAGAGFRFTYGPGSFDRHRREARRLDLVTQVCRDADLAWDIDVPADLERW
ncbi:MAG: 2-phospho-L-lactate guanylyltransferase [Acidimicrobiales bacterium]